MLSQSLTRRAFRQHLWTAKYRSNLINDTRTTACIVPCSTIPQRRHAQTQMKLATKPKSKLAKQPAKSSVVKPVRPVPSIQDQALEEAATGESAVAALPLAPAPAAYGAQLAPSTTGVSNQLVSAKELLADKRIVLLYQSPRHGSLMATSLIAGTAFVSSSAAAIQGMFFTGATFPIWLSVPTALFGTLGIAMGINALVTTLKTIDKVWLIQTPEGQTKLRFETKWRIYFWQPRFIDAELKDVFMDRTVQETDFRLADVDLADRFIWTGQVLQLNGGRLPDPSVPFKERIRDLWPQFKRNLLRTYARVGMSRVRINNTVYKLDVHTATMLNLAQPLAAVIQEDMEERKSVLGIVRQYLIGF